MNDFKNQSPWGSPPGGGGNGGFRRGPTPPDIDEIIKDDIIIEGDKHILKNLDQMLDNFPAWFPIARHNLKFEED